MCCTKQLTPAQCTRRQRTVLVDLCKKDVGSLQRPHLPAPSSTSCETRRPRMLCIWNMWAETHVRNACGLRLPVCCWPRARAQDRSCAPVVSTVGRSLEITHAPIALKERKTPSTCKAAIHCRIQPLAGAANWRVDVMYIEPSLLRCVQGRAPRSSSCTPKCRRAHRRVHPWRAGHERVCMHIFARK